jgi:hypothetical protein
LEAIVTEGKLPRRATHEDLLRGIKPATHAERRERMRQLESDPKWREASRLLERQFGRSLEVICSRGGHEPVIVGRIIERFDGTGQQLEMRYDGCPQAEVDENGRKLRVHRGVLRSVKLRCSSCRLDLSATTDRLDPIAYRLLNTEMKSIELVNLLSVYAGVAQGGSPSDAYRR